MSSSPSSELVTVFFSSETHADIHVDGSVKRIDADSYDDLRSEIFSLLSKRALKLNGPVEAEFVDETRSWVVGISSKGEIIEKGYEPQPSKAGRKTTRLAQPTKSSRVSSTKSNSAVKNTQKKAAQKDTIPELHTLPAFLEILNPEQLREETQESVRRATETNEPAQLPVAVTASHAQPNGSIRGAGSGTRRPTVDDLLNSGNKPKQLKAMKGWRARLRTLTGGLINLNPGPAELAENANTSRVQKRFEGTRTIVVLNPKGGAHKTTSTLLLAATFGRLRGGSTLAWDNNETRGTLGWRAQHAPHNRTAVDLLSELDKFDDLAQTSLSNLDSFVRAQIDARFDVLASDEDAAASSTIDAAAFERLHGALSRYYRMIFIDTGNNMRASNWTAAVEAADQLIIVSTVREDTAASAAWLIDGLTKKGFGDKVERAITILASPSAKPDAELEKRLEKHFSALTAGVTHVPYDSALVDGGSINFDELSKETQRAWLEAAALIADQL